MGREAVCTCTLDGKHFEAKAILETNELILRGGIRKRIPFSQIEKIRTNGANLTFRVGNQRFSLELGTDVAAKWSDAILKPPPTLAKKLGISPGTTIRTIGKIDDDALREAIADARLVAREDADVILARVNMPSELSAALHKAAENVTKGAALWMIYRKGPGHAIGESDVRTAGLAAGFVDVKVASVSSTLTGLKFVKRKIPKK